MLRGTADHVAECPDLGPDCAGPVPPAPFYHHVTLFTTDIGLDGSYGLSSWLAAELHLGVRLVDTTPTYTELDGTPKSVPHDPHHHDETLFGPTDPWFLLRFGARAGKLVTAARIGGSLPIGRTEPNPYVLGAEGKWHEHIQFGTGTFEPIVGLGLSYDTGPVRLDLSGMAFFSLYENGKGYRGPSRGFATVRAAVPLRGATIRPYVEALLRHESEEYWDGLPGLEGTNVKTELILGGGLAWTFADPWFADLGVQVRVASFTDAPVFSYPGILSFGLGTRFDLATIGAH